MTSPKNMRSYTKFIIFGLIFMVTWSLSVVKFILDILVQNHIFTGAPWWMKCANYVKNQLKS